MSACPYTDLPPEAWWKRAVAEAPAYTIQPFLKSKFKLKKNDFISTIGSCFAQEISPRLNGLGLRYLVAEPGPPSLSVEERRKRQYAVFSARYGNVYTTRQFKQLLQMAFGRFEPIELFWKTEKNRYIDPYRPSVEPRGYTTKEELLWDRQSHYRCVREMIRVANVIIFTLGLTECWESKIDGAVFPICPGCGFGTYDSDRYQFVNLRVGDIINDLSTIKTLPNEINPGIKIILTVSPVPLVATMTGDHVLAATTYSKSVLRVAAQDFVTQIDDCAYFPSYEIVVGSHSRGAYFHQDLRSVSRHGVDHVMRCFEATFMSQKKICTQMENQPQAENLNNSVKDPEDRFMKLICDEEELGRRYDTGAGL